MKKMHDTPTGIEIQELKAKYSIGKGSKNLGQRGITKGERCLGASGVQPSLSTQLTFEMSFS